MPCFKTRREKKGFSLVELLIVIALFGFAVSLIAVGFSSFEKNERVKVAVTGLKNDFRLAQNRALSGDKALGDGVDNCSAAALNQPVTLVGYYLTMSKTSQFYQILSDCRDSAGAEVTSLQKSVGLSTSVFIYDLRQGYSPTDPTPDTLYFLFQPLASNVIFFKDPPPFFLADGSIDASKVFNPRDGIVTIQITGPNSDSSGSNSYFVIVKASGEVNETKNTVCCD